jgi:ArsR family transcriptional regulator
MNTQLKIKYELKAKIIKALAHPSRMMIIDAIATQKQAAGDLVKLIGADASTVSKHLSVLKNANLVQIEKQGLVVYYSLTIPCVADFFKCIESILVAHTEHLVHCCKDNSCTL